MMLLSYLASMFATSGFVWYLFERTDKIAKEEIRSSATKFLYSLEIGVSLSLWSTHFSHAFDTLFGKKHLSLTCFLRSSIASIFAAILSFIVYLVIRPENVLSKEFFDIIKMLFLAIITINIVMDYVSLLETRWIIKLIGNNPNTINIFYLLILDLILTSLIFTIFFILLFPLFTFVFLGEMVSWQQTISMFPSVIKNNIFFLGPPPAELGILFYSTFFTSFWVYLYALSCLGIISVSKLKKPWAFLKNRFLNIESNPILVIGWFATLLVVIIYLIMMPFLLF